MSTSLPRSTLSCYRNLPSRVHRVPPSVCWSCAHPFPLLCCKRQRGTANHYVRIESTSVGAGSPVPESGCLLWVFDPSGKLSEVQVTEGLSRITVLSRSRLSRREARQFLFSSVAKFEYATTLTSDVLGPPVYKVSSPAAFSQ